MVTLSIIDVSRFRGALRVPPVRRAFERLLGRIPPAPRSPAARNASAASPRLPVWFEYCVPTYEQDGASCVGHAWANWLELAVRRYQSREALLYGEQIDGARIWRRGRELFWRGDLSDGLYVHQGFHAMLDLGLLPPAARLRQVAPDWASVCAAMAAAPLVQAHRVHQGWQAPNRINGCLDHRYYPAADAGCHCTLRVGCLVQRERRFYASLNSWGPGWGWNGLFVMDEAEDAEGLLPESLYTVDLPAGWARHWIGWRRAIVRKGGVLS